MFILMVKTANIDNTENLSETQNWSQIREGF